MNFCSFNQLLQNLHARRFVYASMFLLMLVSGQLSAQTGNGRVRGTVSDPQKGVIPNVDVVLTNEQTGTTQTVRTTSEGEFTFPQVPLGSYALRVNVSGFQKFDQRGIQLAADQNLTIPVNLAIGSSTQTVSVSATGTQPDTQTGTVKSIIEQKAIQDLPLNGRDPRQLVALSQGVVATTSTFNSNAQSSTLPGTPFFSVNGGRANTLNYLLDGVDNNDSYTNVANPYPDPDSLAQFSVQVSNFDAEYGRNSGAIVDAITKSGTNKLHGSLYEFMRNSTFGLDALGTIDKYNALNSGKIPVINPLHFNQFGGSIGGPVVLPHLYNGRDKVFFFGGYQRTLSHSASQAATEYVPTAAQREGDLSAAGVPVIDPQTGLPFPGNQIPQSRLDPAALQFLNSYVPLPNSTSASNPYLYTFSKPNTSEQDQLSLRGDINLPHSNQLALHYYRFNANIGTRSADQGNLASAQAGFVGELDHAAINLTTIFSSRYVNLLSIGYSHLHTFANQIPSDYPTSQTLGLKVYSVAPNPLYFSVSGFSGATAVYQGLPNNRNNFPLSDALSIQINKHSLKVGGTALRQQEHWIYNQAFPNFSFTGQITGYGLGDFLLGHPWQLNEANTQVLDTRFTEWAAFAQDNWRVSNRLTLDLGLRWEPFIPPHFVGKFNPISVIRPEAIASGQRSTVFPNAPPGLFFSGDRGVPEGGTGASWGNFSPRVGFAYDLSGNQMTVIRGAYGYFIDQPKAINYNRFTNGQPFNFYQTLYNSATSPWNWRDPYNGGPDPVEQFAAQANNPGPDAEFGTPIAGELAFVNFRMPNVQQWNLTIEHQLPAQTMMRVSYVGSKGTHLQWTRDSNAPIRGTGPSSTWAPAQNRRPYNPYFSYINGVYWDGYSKYQSIQLSVEHRFSKGLSATANFVHARTFDSNSDGQEFIATGIQNPYNLREEYGPSDFDVPNNFIASFVYELPIPSTGNRFADLFVRGYQVNGIVSVHSAPPFSIYSVYDNELTTQGYQREKLVGDPHLASRGPKLPYSTYYNTKAYDDTYTPDNDNNISGRNSMRGPGYANLDLSAFKNLNFEHVQLQLRAEAFNAFNNSSLGIDGTSQYHFSSVFGALSTAKGGRVMQFGAHLNF